MTILMVNVIHSRTPAECPESTAGSGEPKLFWGEPAVIRRKRSQREREPVS